MPIDRKKVYNKYDGHCAYCGIELKDESGKYMQVDHKHPKQNRGTDDFDNLMPACLKCNNYKSGWLIENYRTALKETIIKLERITLWRNAIRFGMIEIKEWDGLFYFEKYNKK